MSEAGGIAGAVRRVVAHGTTLLRLERELARAELERKTGVLGAGVVVSIAAGILALFALGFGLAALAAGLALMVDWWLALLIVVGLLVLIVVVLALVARTLFREASPLKPVQALEEAERTKEMLRGVGGNRT